MLNCERVILEENARIRREGKIIGIKAIAKKLISKNMPYEQIAEITELTVEEIAELAEKQNKQLI